MVYNKLKHRVSYDILELIFYIIDESSDSDKGLNLGAEMPQILAVFYLHRIDNYIKTVNGFKYYGRYMDDMYIIHNSKEELKKLSIELREQLALLRLEPNEKKTNIVKLSHGFTFMQIKYYIETETNKIITKPSSSKIARERRRLKKYKKLYDDGKLNELEIYNNYKSWKKSLIKDCNSCDGSIKSMG